MEMLFPNICAAHWQLPIPLSSLSLEDFLPLFFLPICRTHKQSLKELRLLYHRHQQEQLLQN